MKEEKSLPFDTTRYDDLPVSTVIYEPVRDSDGALVDYIIAYGNNSLLADWEKFRPGVPMTGAGVMSSGAMNRDVLYKMDMCQSGDRKPFSVYIPEGDMHVHFQPMKPLPAPYAGFFLTNVSDYEERSSKIHFLRSIRQMENAAVLLRETQRGRIETVFVSERFARLMECDVDEAMRIMDGKHFILSTHPDDRLPVRRMLRRHISDEGTRDLTVRKVTAKGNTIWTNVHYSFIDDFNEHYIYCTYFDVTAARVYEERLRATYMSIVDTFYRENQNTLGMFRVNLTRDRVEDMRGRDLFGTDSAMRPFSEIVRLRAVNYPLERERRRFLELLDIGKLTSAYLSGRAQLSEYFFSRRKDGRLCYVNSQVMMTRHPVTAEIVAFIAEQEASREKVEAALLDRILARQFDMVAYLANGRYGVVVGDASLIEKGSIFPLARNGDYAEYLESQVFPVLHGDEGQRAAMGDALSLSNVIENVKKSAPYIVNIACDIDGETYYKRFDFYTIDPGADFFILLKSDTTEIQKKQIEQNERLKNALTEAKQASVAKTAFLSRMSHEIRTPMNAIIGLDNIALHEAEISDTIRGYLEKIGSSARYLLSLINDILDMSRIESGRMTVKNEEFSFHAFIEQIETMVNGQCRDKGLNFHCTMRGDIGEYYIGDDTKLKQVLINILGNAVKFTDPGGDIYLTAECTARYEGQSSFQFIIRDTGIGMDKEYLPKIFEAFSQEDDTTTSSYGGSGLGMAITKNIVEMMNGTILVDSEKGVGSVFIVTLPLRDSKRADEVHEGEIHPQDLSVLVIDDDSVARETVKSVLDEAGIGSEIASGGEEALSILRLKHARREEYNLILVDLKMPEKDGVEVAREARKILGDDTTIIIMTAYDWFEIEDEARAAGVDGFIAKPISASNLLYEFSQIAHRKKPEEKEETPLADLTGKRILVAEDMLVNAEIMKELLKMMGMEAEHAENGKIAVEMFTSHPAGYYDAILMDVRMPVMDGLTATAKIRETPHPDAGEIPIIAMTANAFDEDVQRSLQAGMNAHLAKPVEPEHMMKTLAGLIGKRKAGGN